MLSFSRQFSKVVDSPPSSGVVFRLLWCGRFTSREPGLTVLEAGESNRDHFWFNGGRAENWQAAQFEKLDASEPGCRRVSVTGMKHTPALSNSERKGFISRPGHSLSMKEVRTGTETRQGRGGRAGAEAMEKAADRLAPHELLSLPSHIPTQEQHCPQ